MGHYVNNTGWIALVPSLGRPLMKISVLRQYESTQALPCIPWTIEQAPSHPLNYHYRWMEVDVALCNLHGNSPGSITHSDFFRNTTMYSGYFLCD